MADPIIVKVSDLTELSALASGDLLEVVDVSESVVSEKTKKLQAQSIKIFNANQLSANVVTGPAIANASVSLAKLASDAALAIRNLIYIQLFPAGDLIVNATGKAYFFVPSQLTGMKIKKVGMGIVTPASPAANTTVALGTYASIAGNGYIEGADINVSLPAAGTKIPINVTAGTGSPKGLDFWFVVGI